MFKKGFLIAITLTLLLMSFTFSVAAETEGKEESIFDQSMEITDAELGVVGSQGTLFSVKKAGKITAVKRYVVNPGVHKVSIWETDAEASDANAKMIAGIYDWDVASGNTGWQTFLLPTALDVTPGKFYLVAISTATTVEPPSGTHFSAVQGYFSTRNNANSNIITYANSSRQYNAGDGTIYPSLQNTMWDFCVDIVYKANVPPSAGKVPNIVDQSTAASLAEDGGGNWNYGTEFQVLVKGKITKIRAYIKAGVSGNVNAAIWNKDTQTKLTSNIVWDIGEITSDGWIEYALDTPISVSPDVNYVVSVSTHDQGDNINDFVYTDNIIGDDYAFNTNTFKEVYGVFIDNRDDMPTTRSMDGKRYFFRDVVFEIDTPVNPNTNDYFNLTLVVFIFSCACFVLKKKSFLCK